MSWERRGEARRYDVTMKDTRQRMVRKDTRHDKVVKGDACGDSDTHLSV